MRFVVAFALTVVCAQAQRIPMPPPSSELDRYLEITPDQNRLLAENLAAYTSWSRDKSSRLNQVRQEIAMETAKDQLDALALGMRYVEVEAICRQDREKQQELRRNNINVLTMAQKAKMAALEETAKLFPLILEASARNLTSAPAMQVSFVNGLPASGGFASFLLGGVPVPNLQASCATPAFRFGDFLPFPVTEPTPRE